MKKLFLGLAGLALAAAGSANAADLGPRPVYKAPPPVVAPIPFSWTGFYIGANVGGAWSSNRSVEFTSENEASEHFLFDVGLLTGTIAAPVSVPINLGHSSGFVGGGQIGYNFQFSPMWVAGIEADLDGADVRGSAVIPTLFNAEVVASRRLEWFGTVRGRLGLTPFDRLLIYGTGGVAFGEEKADVSINNVTITFGTGVLPDGSSIICFAGSACVAGSGSRTSAGWTAGGGFEYAIWNNLSIKAEYLFMDLGHLAVQMRLPPGVPSTLNNPAVAADFGEGRYHIFRVGLNWHFGLGKGKAPVVASY
jgi:outer membrane immunogenic protein